MKILRIKFDSLHWLIPSISLSNVALFGADNFRVGRFSPFTWLLFLFCGRYTETNLFDVLMKCLLWQLIKVPPKNYLTLSFSINIVKLFLRPETIWSYGKMKNQEKQSQSESVIHGLVQFPEIINKFSRQWGLIFFKYSLRLHHKISMPQFYIMMSKTKR